jgi:hypothetical protein
MSAKKPLSPAASGSAVAVGSVSAYDGATEPLLFMPVSLLRVFLATAVLAKLHVHRLSVSDNL